MSLSTEELVRAALVADVSFLDFGNLEEQLTPEVLNGLLRSFSDQNLPSGLRYTQSLADEITAQFTLLRFRDSTSSGLEAGLFRHEPTGQLYLSGRGIEDGGPEFADYFEAGMGSLVQAWAGKRTIYVSCKARTELHDVCNAGVSDVDRCASRLRNVEDLGENGLDNRSARTRARVLRTRSTDE